MTAGRDDETEILLNAYVDGELDAVAASRFEERLAAEPGLAAARARLITLRQQLRDDMAEDVPPAALRQAIVEQFARPVRSRLAGWGALAAALLVGIVLGSAAAVGFLNFNRADPIAGQIVAAHIRALMAPQPIDVASSDRHTVKPWLAGRTTVSADIVDLAPQGFTLAGGRITVVDRIPAPTLVYRHAEHLIALTELPLDTPGGPGDGNVETIDGYHVARWASPSLGFLAVSDSDAATLAEFVAAFRHAHAPASEPRGG